MKKIFEEGTFLSYAKTNLTEARGSIPSYIYASKQPTIFISHKHDDLEDLKGVIGFLEKKYNAKCYIDSKDPTMPKVTSTETASNIKSRINECDKFILLATNGAIQSKWCNWELGYGDAQKNGAQKLALFPLKPVHTGDNEYSGSEYMALYPSICYYDGSEYYRNGKAIAEGYYVRRPGKEGYYIEPLEEWIAK